MNSVVVYFPWGAGGNLIKNLITIDTRFKFFDNREFNDEYPTVEKRFTWLRNYYQQPVDPATWLTREWSIRAKAHRQYCVGGQVTYWDPEQLIVYDIHGEQGELPIVNSNRHLKSYDRYKIEEEKSKPEQISPWGLRECEHIFLLPEDLVAIAKITEIYNSKNPTINQLEPDFPDMDDRRRSALIAITTMTQRLEHLLTELLNEQRSVQVYHTGDLYSAVGYKVLIQIIGKLKLDIPTEYAKELHSIWLQSTKDVYYNYFQRELT